MTIAVAGPMKSEQRMGAAVTAPTDGDLATVPLFVPGRSAVGTNSSFG